MLSIKSVITCNITRGTATTAVVLPSPTPPVVELASFMARIGDILITGETKLTDSFGVNVNDLLLCDGSTISAETYPLLVAELGNTTLPNIADETGSPFPYKIVGDLT